MCFRSFLVVVFVLVLDFLLYENNSFLVFLLWSFGFCYIVWKDFSRGIRRRVFFLFCWDVGLMFLYRYFFDFGIGVVYRAGVLGFSFYCLVGFFSFDGVRSFGGEVYWFICFLVFSCLLLEF